MTRTVESIAIAAYVVLAILVGGSAQSIWGNLALQILGVAFLAYVAAVRPGSATGRVSAPTLLLLATLLLVLLQLIPLPPGLWSSLPGRAELADGFSQLGYSIPYFPVAENPYGAVAALFAAIPAIAAYAVTRRLQPEPRVIAMGVAGATIISIVLGALQVVGGPKSSTYLYPITNYGAVGFFANQNHMATLLLVAIPMTLLLFTSKQSDGKTTSGRYATAIVLLALLLGGVALNGSLAAYALVLPVLLASLSLFQLNARWGRILLPLSLVMVVAGTALMANSSIGTGSAETNALSSVSSRTQIWNNTTRAIGDNFPVGTGLGSFQGVYHRYEDPAQVTSEYVNHAHNDYLELILELGLPGLLLLIAFGVWWTIAAVRSTTSPLSTRFARASAIASAAILAHSAVDFPLRTAAISVIFGVSIALMVQRQEEASVAKKGDIRPTRHVELG